MIKCANYFVRRAMAIQLKKRRSVRHDELQKVIDKMTGAQALKGLLKSGVCPDAVSRGTFSDVHRAPLWAAAAMSGREALEVLERAGCVYQKIDGQQDYVDFCMGVSPEAGFWALERAIGMGDVAKTVGQRGRAWLSWSKWFVDAHMKSRSRAGDGKWPIDESDSKNMQAAVAALDPLSKLVARYAGQPSLGLLVQHVKNTDWTMALALAMNMDGSAIAKRDRAGAGKKLSKAACVKDVVNDSCRPADEFAAWTARELGKRLSAMGLGFDVAEAVESGSWEALECALAQGELGALRSSSLARWCSLSLLGREGAERDEFGEILLWRLSFWAYTATKGKEFESCIMAGAKLLLKAGGSLTAKGPDGQCAMDKAIEYRKRMEKAAAKIIATNWGALTTGAASRDPREILCSWIEVMGERELLGEQLGEGNARALDVKRL